MISDLQHEPSEQADTQEEEVDPLVEEDVQVGHQARKEDRWIKRFINKVRCYG